MLALLTLLQQDGVVLRMLRTMLGSLIGYGLYVLPFSLFGLAALLIARNKGPVRLRAAGLGMFPLVFGALSHGMLRAGQYPVSLKAFSLLMQAGANLKSGGLLAGGLYCLMEWAFSGIGAMILMLILLVVDVMVMFRITPQSIYNALRPIDYEYDSDEERQKYEAPAVLPNVHELAAAHKAKRKARAAFDIPIEGEDETDETIPQAAPVPAPEPIAVDEPEKADPFGDILSLIRNKPEKKKDTVPAGSDPENAPEPIEDDTPPWEAEPISKAEQKKQEARENAALAAEMDRNGPGAGAGIQLSVHRVAESAQGSCQGQLSAGTERIQPPPDRHPAIL